MTTVRPNRRRIAPELQTGSRPACALRRAGLPPIHNSRSADTDSLGRRISKNGEFYSYNERSELTGAVNEAAGREYGYKFDDIGNRESAFENSVTNRYAANALNQYAAVDDFTPQYDDDGNQTLVKTATGIWQVSYNGENRPVRWVKGDEVIAMSFDRMGRRVAKNNQRFVYDGYLQIADNSGNAYVWDPTESVATRPLVWRRASSVAYYAHDGNKNVADVIASNGDIVAHYDYAPFGGVTAHSGALASANPWRFSSEYADRDLGLVYYNYRHYDPVMGRWTSRDPIEELRLLNATVISVIVASKDTSYSFVDNHVIYVSDLLGLISTGVKSCVRDMDGTGAWHAYIQVGDWAEGWAGDPYPEDLSADEARGCNEMNPRSNGNMPNGKPCKCATAKEMQDCVKNPSNWPTGTYTLIGRNCGTWVKEVAKRCCLRAKFTAPWFHHSATGAGNIGGPVVYGPSIGWKWK